MRIFITGASGFVGGALAKYLGGKSGYTVTAMSRSEKSDRSIREAGATPVRCELGSVDVSVLRDVDVLVHCAAYVSQSGRRADFMRVTVEGTRQLLEVAQAAGVKRFVHMGTEAALFAGQPLVNIDENTPYPSKHRYLYSESKAIAEQLVLAANQPGTFETISLRPRLVWGPGNQTVLPALVEMIQRGAFMWMDHGRHRTDTTHIANLVHATELALTKGQGGRAYFITDDEQTTFREFLGALVKTRGVQAPENKNMPGGVARALSVPIEGVWNLLRLRGEPPLTRFAAAIMSRECTIRIDRAKTELGYAPVISVADGLRELKQAA